MMRWLAHDSFSDFQQAVLGLYQRSRNAYPEMPMFILGHSMGGLITSRFLIDHQDKFAGALLSGPAIQTAQKPAAWQVGLIKSIAKFLPKIGLVPVDGSMVSRDPAVVDAYNNHAHAIDVPLFIMHGTADQLTMPEGSQWLYETVVSKDKTIRLYEGLYHEIFNEPEAESIFGDVIEWLDERVT